MVVVPWRCEDELRLPPSESLGKLCGRAQAGRVRQAALPTIIGGTFGRIEQIATCGTAAPRGGSSAFARAAQALVSQGLKLPGLVGCQHIQNTFRRARGALIAGGFRT